MSRPKPRLRCASDGTWYCTLYGITMSADTALVAFEMLQRHIDNLQMRVTVSRIVQQRRHRALAYDEE